MKIILFYINQTQPETSKAIFDFNMKYVQVSPWLEEIDDIKEKLVQKSNKWLLETYMQLHGYIVNQIIQLSTKLTFLIKNRY